mmetsp:Transcript_8654/g.30815  ORF Transcript_8654/g.30815 Transcript_8654/m.30815 type:complete len:83 (-) Transcript_8654:178-426(-)
MSGKNALKPCLVDGAGLSMVHAGNFNRLLFLRAVQPPGRRRLQDWLPVVQFLSQGVRAHGPARRQGNKVRHKDWSLPEVSLF